MNDSERVAHAFAAVERTDFIPNELKAAAGQDMPLPIGYGQTISQPSTVRLMLEWLAPQPGDRVLDIGSGSGWTTALLSYLVRPSGQVYAVEKIPELFAFGRRNCERLGLKNIQFFPADMAFGLPHCAPYERILVSAAADTLPSELLEQLAVGGKLVIPVGHSILEITRRPAELKTVKHPGFIFVPLIG